MKWHRWALGGHIIPVTVPTTIFIPTGILVAGTFPLVESLVMSYYKGFGSFSLKLYAKLNLHNIKQLHMIT